ncbi:MAG: hypothetical protein R3Y19_01220 [Rikenellaceae bacterium]
MYIKFNILKTTITCLEDAIRELLRQISHMEQPVRLNFFGAVDNNAQYMADLAQIHDIVSGWYPLSMSPLVGYIAQAPVDCTFAMELQSVPKSLASSLEFKCVNGARYAVLNGMTAEKMVMSEALCPSSLELSIEAQSREVFEKLYSILEAEQMAVKNIDRQWNYIEHITRCEHDLQHYQVFNDVRSEYYSHTEWTSGYPAATGIGTVAGGIIIEIDAATLRNTRTVALDNSLQIAAHEYSKSVLLGEATQKSTPKFERARAIVYQSIFGDREAMIYISGTAAIRGELSLLDMGIADQTRITLENIAYLIGLENLEKHGIEPQRLPVLKYMRVYLKYAKDFVAAREVVSRIHPTIPALYVVSDVCRDELLIEIEGLAE